MVKEYLEKTRDEFLDTKCNLSEKLVSAENHYKENLKIIQMLEESSDTGFEAFSPREVNSYNRSKISELKEEQKLVEPQIKVLRKQISDVDCKLDEINSVIKVCKSDRDASVELSDVISNTETELCIKLLDMDPIRCRLELSSQGKILKDIINELRNMIYNLRPMSFDDIGFDVTVERALDKFKASNNVRCNFKILGEPYVIDSLVSLTLLRVIQEACSNSIKHGNASEIDVVLKYDTENLILNIKDNGDGFNTSTIPETTRNDNSGFGLSMMKERIYLLSGKLEIISKPGEGCETIVTVPVKKEDN